VYGFYFVLLHHQTLESSFVFNSNINTGMFRLFLLTGGTMMGLSLAASACTFCTLNPAGAAVNFDLSGLPQGTWASDIYTYTSPCGQANTPTTCGRQNDSMTQSCKGLGTLANISVDLAANNGVTVTLHGGFDDPPMANGRNAVYHFICDTTVPATNPPDANVTEQPGGFYNLIWRHPAACGVVGGTSCGPSPPVPPPVPPPAPCSPGASTCLPSWTPTWGMKASTVLYTCNNSGMHSVEVANQYGVVVYDWSNAKAIWANAHPMTSEELITAQAEAVLAADPGVEGSMPRVWAYRNTIKALNWYWKIRVKLDDPRYADWFIKFKGFSNTPYPGGQGLSVNGSFHVPVCDFYNNGTAPRCSGFYHDQVSEPLDDSQGFASSHSFTLNPFH
jgi:hypothetical protein